MVKKKAFIDKKKSVTYSLVYREPSEDADGDDGGQRVLAPVEGPRGPFPASNDYYDNYDNEGSVYDSEYSLAFTRSAAAHHDESYTLSEERRRELLALGFPDDGYDYLKHLRDLGRGAQAPGAGGRGVGGGVATIPEDQELDGFDDNDDDEGGDAAWHKGSDSGDDFTMYDQPEEDVAAAVATEQRGRLDAAALVAAATAAAANGAGTSNSRGGRAAAEAAAGPGPGSTRAAAAAAAGARSVTGRSTAACSMAARSIATTARTDGSGLGPSVYVPAAKLVAPKPDVRVVDARRLVVRPKGHDEAAAAESLAEVAALSRHTELYGKRGRLYQDLDEVEKSMAAVESGNDPSRAEQVEGDEWAEWLDDFVAGRGDDDGGGPAAAATAAATTGQAEAAGGLEDDDDEEWEEGGESEDPEEEEEDADEWSARHRRQRQQQRQQQQQLLQGDSGEREGPPAVAAAAAPSRAGGGAGGGVGAASVASSLWHRPERRDRKEGFEALDAQFERLAVEYDDDEIGALDDGRYDDDEEDDENDDEDDDGEDSNGDGDCGTAAAAAAAARRRCAAPPAAAGKCELLDFADVLDEFLSEHRAAEALEAEGLRPIQVSDDVALQASRPDPEALAATRARLQRQLEASARAAAAATAGDQDEPVRTIVVQETERWDCESILSLTSNLENHPATIVEPQRRMGARGGGLIRLSAKTGMPVLPSGQAAAATRGSAAALADSIPEEADDAEEETEEDREGGEEDEDDAGGSVQDPALLTRRRGETAEERRARKAAVKEARRNQRTAKKEMKTLFRQQASRAQKQAVGRPAGVGSTYAIP